ncbi:MAG TPA: cupin domain-containing protein [Actinomycetota bacterium]|nr:cupin domain-containing protein [Actinomycetota bacterium]
MGGRPYRVNLSSVPLVPGLRAEEGWLNMEVQFLVDERSAGARRLLLGRTVFPPGAAHERHRHRAAEEFPVLLEGRGVGLAGDEEFPLEAGDVLFIPPGEWHGFRNTSDRPAVMLWGWGGAGSLEAAGYEARPRGGP